MSAEAYQKILARKRRRILERADQLRRTFAFLPLKKIILEVTAAEQEFEHLSRSNYR